MNNLPQSPAPDALPGIDDSLPTHRSITLKDVAKIAGLSPITVSRALHNPELVKPETIDRVREAVALTGYIPNAMAGSLASKRSKLIAAVVPQLSNPMFVEMVHGLESELSANGYQLLLSLSGYSQQKEEDIIAMILSRQPDGIVLTGINHEPAIRKRLIAAGVPVVETWDITPTPIDMLVGFSHYKIGEAIGNFLFDKGRRRFGLISADDRRAAIRRNGLEQALAMHGISAPTAAIVPIPASIELGRSGMRALLANGQDFDAIVCSSDVLAHGALIEAQTCGLRIPESIYVIGFGDLDFSAHTAPSISSIHVDKQNIGVMAARALLGRIKGQPRQNSIIDVGFKLIERESTAGVRHIP